ncbi:type VII secretion protein EccCa [Corynebacterium yudongzhengii]|nr:type VII secretion protein EccCa [Corynebacterium yudongzhengii]
MPAAQRPKPMPIIRILMPVIMVAAMVAMVAVMFAGGRAASPMMLVLPLMMGVSMLMMFSPPQSEGDVDETRRTYLRHLQIVREKALSAAARQRSHELHRHPSPDELLSRVGTARMWERAGEDDDVLEVRLGTGAASLSTSLEVKDSGAAEDLEPVCAVSLRRTLAAVSTVADMPVVVQLRAFRFLSLNGPQAPALTRALIAQLTTAHGPDTLGIELVGGGFDELKWYPHAHQPTKARHRVLIVSETMTNGTEAFIDDEAYTCLIEVDTRSAASALRYRAEAEGIALRVGEHLAVTTATGSEDLGSPDALSSAAAAQHARAMTAYRRSEHASGRSSNELLALVGLGGVESLDPARLWPQRTHASTRLVTPIGVTETGAPLKLDMKESAQGGMGPHGLCIGATGSGKSELLRTLVAGLSLTHDPSELNLVLVDFKGGATFLGCEKLPHTSAVITNLEDEAVLVERMYDALSGELNRRQEVLRRAGNFANITDYAQARRSTRPDLEALPALVIVVDEFSELLGQHPDFADLFVAIGRLGRSLGVHLLLASQRLEEGKLRGLDSHLSYRIGLKTFSAGESRQVLGVADAHELPARPGAGFLRTDAQRLVRFQAAYVSGPARRHIRRSPVQPETSVRRFTGVEPAAEPDITETIEEDHTLLDAVVTAAQGAAEIRGLSAHRIWLDPLPEMLELSAVAEEEPALQPVIGIIDRPYRQRQDPLRIDLKAGGGHVAVCGGPQSGKSGALRTLVASAAVTADTSTARFYIIDFGSALAHLARLPHVAGYADRSNEERIRRIVDEVGALVDKPEKRHTFLVIDGWHAIATTGGELDDLVDPVTRLAADGPAARVHLILSTPRWSTIRPALRDLITHRIELRLVEPLDSVIDRKAQKRLPTHPGRGLAPDGSQMLIAHTAAQDIEHIRATTAGEPVPALKELPAQLQLSELDTSVPVAFGRGGPALETLSWRDDDGHLVITGQAGAGKSTALATIMHGIVGLGPKRARLVVIDPRRAHLGRIDEAMLAAYAASSTAVGQVVRDTVATLSARLPDQDISVAELKERSWWSGPEIYVVIDDLDLVADNDIHALLELIPHARDIGLHLVIARRSGGIGRALFSGLLAAVRKEQHAAIVLSADRDDGTLFGVNPTTQPPGRGTYVARGGVVGTCQIARKDTP